MGARGPAPTPTAILAARGSWRAKKRTGEPVPTVEKPSCPRWLSKEGRAEWERQVRELLAMGVLAKVDRAALAIYCEAWAEFVTAVEGLAKAGFLTKNKKTSAWERQLLSARARSADLVIKLAAQFGFTPAARTRLRSAEESPLAQNSKDRFFKPSAN